MKNDNPCLVYLDGEAEIDITIIILKIITIQN